MFRLAVVALVLCALPALAQTKDEKKATLAYLKKLRNSDGGFRLNAKAEKSSLRATSTALRALRYFGGEIPNAGATMTFILSCYDKKTGSFADIPGGKTDPVLTSVGLMALTEVKGLTPVVEKAAVAYLADKAKKFEEVRMAAAGLETINKKSKSNATWLKMLADMQNDDGTFGKGAGQARDTGGAAAAVLRLGGKLKDEKAVLKVLHNGQRDDGGYGQAKAKTSDLETTYRVTRSLHMLKSKPPKVAACKTFVAKCRNEDGGYGVTPGAPSSTAGTYFAAIILHWLDGK